jgi:anthranilate phosphoribosyltransferase
VSIAGEIDRLLAGESLRHDEAAAALDLVMSGKVDPVQTGAFLIALRAKGETAEELAGLAATVRARSEPVTTTRTPLVDTCGTGGGRSTFNVSTAAAFVVAGAGIPVAKHGNRSATSRTGSADVLEALGARIDLDSSAVSACLDRAGIGFMFAPLYHPAFRHVVPVRKALGVRTIFNMLGPLTNPAGVRRQVIGVSDPEFVDRIAMALEELGADHALVVSSADGMDEISSAAPTDVVEVSPRGVRRWRIEPQELGITGHDPAHVAGGEPDENAAVIRAALDGENQSAADLVAINAAAAILVSGSVDTLEDGLAAARDSIATGRARDALQAFIEATNELAPPAPEEHKGG